jgi:hypothetical protein
MRAAGHQAQLRLHQYRLLRRHVRNVLRHLQLLDDVQRSHVVPGMSDARRTFARLFLPVAMLVGSAVASRPAHGQGAVDQAEAEIRLGTELRHQNQDARALPHFDRAYQLSRNPRTAAQLGLVKMALGYCVDAERLLDEALAVPDHPWIARNVSALTQTRESARRNIGQVSVTGNPVGAQILVNGHPAGSLPLGTALKLDRGPVEIEVRAAGYAPFTRSLNITAGARETIVVALVPNGPAAPIAVAPRTPAAPAVAPTAAPSPPAPPPVPPPAAPSAPPADLASAGSPSSAPALAPEAGEGRPGAPSSPPLKPLAFAAGGLAAAGLVLGIVETITASRRADDFNNHTVASPTAAEPNRRVPDCETSQLTDACRSIRDAHDRARTLAIVGYVGAGAFAALSTMLFVLDARRTGLASDAVADRRLTCTPTLGTPGASCRLAF